MTEGKRFVIEWKNWSFSLVWLMVALLVISLKWLSPTWQIIFSFSYLFLHLNYFFRYTWYSKKLLYPRSFYICYFIIAFLLFSALTAAYSKEPTLAISLLLAMAFGILFSFCFMSFILLLIVKDLKGKKRIFFIILAYLCLAGSIILLFTITYPFAYVFSGNSLQTNSDLISTNQTSDFLYFSSATFYSASYGEIFPVGDEIRFLTQLEVICGVILHVIVLAWILSKPENSDS